MPLLSPVTSTPQYLQELVDFSDLETVIDDLKNERYNYCDICIQNMWDIQIRVEYWKDAIAHEWLRLSKWASLITRIVFNITDLTFNRISLVTGSGSNDKVTYIILPSYKND